MNVSGVARRARKTTLGAVLLSSIAVLVLGCDQADARSDQKDLAAQAQAPIESPATPASAPAGEVQAKGVGQQAYDEEAFQLTFEAPKTASVGVPLTATVVLVAKNGYKVNDEYPIKFKLDESSAVKSTKDTVRKEDAKLEKMRVEMPVQLTVTQAGETQVSGRLSFSVCTEERCLIEKRDLKLSVNAS